MMNETKIITPSYLNSPDYDFLKTNSYLGDNIILLGLGGSHAYGLNTPTSDVDVRGIALNPKHQIYGLEKDFEQVVETNTDTTIYSINKMVRLLTECNPNTIEILGCKPEHYLYIHPFGQKVLDNKENFLSVRAIDTFGGYARAQYNRLEHALLGNGHNDEKKLDMMKHSMECAINAFNAKHKHTPCNISIRILPFEEYKGVIQNRLTEDRLTLKNLYHQNVAEVSDNPNLIEEEKVSKIQSLTDILNNNLNRLENIFQNNLENANDNVGERIVLSGDFADYPTGELQALLRELNQIKADYGNINKRNHKKDTIHMAKHMAHLLRLYKMGTKLNQNMDIHTYWEGKDKDQLMSVRMGNYMTEDGLRVKSEFFDLLKTVQDEYEYSVKHTILPEKPNLEAINEMLSDIYTEAYHQDIQRFSTNKIQHYSL